MVPYSKLHAKVLLSHDIPDRWKSHRIDNTKLLYGETQGIASLIQYANQPEYSLYFTRMESSSAEDILLIRDQPAYCLVVQLLNTLQATAPGLSPLRLLEWSFNFFYLPVFDLDIRMPGNAVQETFFLLVPEAFVQYFAKQHDMLHEFHNKARSKTALTLLPQPKICPPEAMKKIMAVKSGTAGKLSLEYADELLSHIFESAYSSPYRKILDDDQLVGRLYALKSYLQSNPQGKFTKAALMHQFRLNTQQFNQGFASIYDLTPFAFLKYLRKQG